VNTLVKWEALHGRICLQYVTCYGGGSRKGWTLFLDDGVRILLRPWYVALLMVPGAVFSWVCPRLYYRWVLWRVMARHRKNGLR